MTLSDQKLQELIKSVGVVAYEWDISTDQLTWSDGAGQILYLAGLGCPTTGKEYAALLEASALKNSRCALLELQDMTKVDVGSGVPYTYSHALCPQGQEAEKRIWVEDSGRWFGGFDGKPVLAHGLLRIITENHRHEEQLLYLSTIDELTGQLNRRSLMAALGESLEQAIENKSEAAFLVIAVDNLDVINGLCGFEIADALLKGLAASFRKKIRGDDVIGRYSGNKFGIILKNCSEAGVKKVINRLIQAAQETASPIGYKAITSTISIGAVRLPEHAKEVSTATINAHESLNVARKKSGYSWIIYQESEKRASLLQRNMDIIDMVSAALNDRRVTYSLQPVVSAVTEQTVFQECLIRIRKTDGSLLGAGDFIEHAESLGLIRLLDYRIVELALSHLIQNPKERLSVNVSLDTVSDTAWLDLLKTQAASHPDLASRLTVEITETKAISDMQEANRLILALQQLGCKIAIDDFGAGYTSFRNLKLLDIDMVKIDGSFVKNLSKEPENQIFVRTLIDLSRSFGIESVAEWVETREDAELLKRFGITYMQGHLFGRAKLSEILPQNTTDYISSPAPPRLSKT